MPLALPRKSIEIFSRLKTPAEYKSTVFNILKDMDDVEVMYNAVLVATYIRPELTSGGIIRPQDNVNEDIWQGKAGLVIKLGKSAFQDDEYSHFGGQKVAVGDWVAFFIGDAKLLNIKDVPCRLIEDSNIKLKLKDPSVVF